MCFTAFVPLCKRKLHADFHKKILIFMPPGIFENETLPNLDLDFYNYTWPLVKCRFLYDLKNKNHSTWAHSHSCHEHWAMWANRSRSLFNLINFEQKSYERMSKRVNSQSSFSTTKALCTFNAIQNGEVSISPE